MDANNVIHPGFIAVLFAANVFRWVYLTFYHPAILDFLPKWQMNMPALLVRVYMFAIYSWMAWFQIPIDMFAVFARIGIFAWGAEELVAFLVMISFERGYKTRG